MSSNSPPVLEGLLLERALAAKPCLELQGRHMPMLNGTYSPGITIPGNSSGLSLGSNTPIAINNVNYLN